MYHSKNIKKRNTLIFEDYVKLYFTDFLREEVIWEQLGEKYFLSARSIYLIVLEKRKEVQATQPELPLNKPANGTDQI